MKKYLDLATRETVVIQRLSAQQRITDADLSRAVSMDELLTGVKEDIHEMFKTTKR